MNKFLFAICVVFLGCVHQADAAVNLAWACSNPAAAGTSAGTTAGCAANMQRWDYGDAGHLVAACPAAACTGWQQAVWTSWASVTGPVFVCRLDRQPSSWNDCSSEGYVARAQVAVSGTPPPTCPPPQPANESQTVQCTAPQIGTWTQTRSYSCPSPPTWSAGTWTPASAPAGACTDPPTPPAGPPSAPYEVQVVTNHDSCQIASSMSGVRPNWLEAQRLGSAAIARGQDDVPHITCVDLGLTESSQAIFYRLRVANAGGPSAWSGYFPIMRFPAEPADPNVQRPYRVQYVVIKQWDDELQIPSVDPPKALCMVDTVSSGVRNVYAKLATGSRGAIVGTIPVGSTPQFPTAPSIFDRVECSCTDGFTYSSSWYGKVAAPDGYVAACRAYGVH